MIAIAWFDYDLNVMSSYKQVEHIESLFGNRLVDCEEFRDSTGHLKQYKVTYMVDDSQTP